MKLRGIAILALLTIILFISQIAFAFLPNIELVSLLILIYTLIYKKRVFYIIYGFAILEGLFYGFGIWWIMYLYVWSILAIIVLILQKNESFIIWGIVSGVFGLMFGFLCSLPYFLIMGFAGGFAYFISGIPFDILHCFGNVLVTLILFKPVYHIVRYLEGKYGS